MIVLQVGLLLSAAAQSAALWVSHVRTVADWGSAEQQARLESLKPLIHVHIPKTGSTFINVIAEHPGICPHLQGGFTQEMIDQYGDFADNQFRAGMNEENCPGGLAGDYFHFSFGHGGLRDIPKEVIKGHSTIMLRQPEARLLSAFEFNASFLPDWPEQRFHWSSFRGPPPATFKEYAQAMQGATVKILTRGGIPTSSGGPDNDLVDPPTIQERDEALRMLREDFAFVGITEHWDLSVCLFHAMYGGDCGSDEFGKMRAGEYHTRDSLADLNGWRDVHDGALYEEGMQIFKENLERYDVSEANCPRSCRSTIK